MESEDVAAFAAAPAEGAEEAAPSTRTTTPSPSSIRISNENDTTENQTRDGGEEKKELVEGGDDDEDDFDAVLWPRLVSLGWTSERTPRASEPNRRGRTYYFPPGVTRDNGVCRRDYFDSRAQVRRYIQQQQEEEALSSKAASASASAEEEEKASTMAVEASSSSSSIAKESTTTTPAGVETSTRSAPSSACIDVVEILGDRRGRRLVLREGNDTGACDDDDGETKETRGYEREKQKKQHEEQRQQQDKTSSTASVAAGEAGVSSPASPGGIRTTMTRVLSETWSPEALIRGRQAQSFPTASKSVRQQPLATEEEEEEAPSSSMMEATLSSLDRSTAEESAVAAVVRRPRRSKAATELSSSSPAGPSWLRSSSSTPLSLKDRIPKRRRSSPRRSSLRSTAPPSPPPPPSPSEEAAAIVVERRPVEARRLVLDDTPPPSAVRPPIQSSVLQGNNEPATKWNHMKKQRRRSPPQESTSAGGRPCSSLPSFPSVPKPSSPPELEKRRKKKKKRETTSKKASPNEGCGKDDDDDAVAVKEEEKPTPRARRRRRALSNVEETTASSSSAVPSPGSLSSLEQNDDLTRSNSRYKKTSQRKQRPTSRERTKTDALGTQPLDDSSRPVNGGGGGAIPALDPTDLSPSSVLDPTDLTFAYLTARSNRGCSVRDEGGGTAAVAPSGPSNEKVASSSSRTHRRNDAREEDAVPRNRDDVDSAINGTTSGKRRKKRGESQKDGSSSPKTAASTNRGEAPVSTNEDLTNTDRAATCGHKFPGTNGDASVAEHRKSKSRRGGSLPGAVEAQGHRQRRDDVQAVVDHSSVQVATPFDPVEAAARRIENRKNRELHCAAAGVATGRKLSLASRTDTALNASEGDDIAVEGSTSLDTATASEESVSRVNSEELSDYDASPKKKRRGLKPKKIRGGASTSVAAVGTSALATNAATAAPLVKKKRGCPPRSDAAEEGTVSPTRKRARRGDGWETRCRRSGRQTHAAEGTPSTPEGGIPNLVPNADFRDLSRIMEAEDRLAEEMRLVIIRAAVHTYRSQNPINSKASFVGCDGRVYPWIARAFASFSRIHPCANCKRNKMHGFHCRLKMSHDALDYNGGSSFEALLPLIELPLKDLVLKPVGLDLPDQGSEALANQGEEITSNAPNEEIRDAIGNMPSWWSMDRLSDDLFHHVVSYVPSLSLLVTLCQTSKRGQNLLYRSIHSEALFRGVYVNAFGDANAEHSEGLSWRVRWTNMFALKRGLGRQARLDQISDFRRPIDLVQILKGGTERDRPRRSLGLLTEREELEAILYDNPNHVPEGDQQLSIGYFGMNFLNLDRPREAPVASTSPNQRLVAVWGDFNGVRIFNSLDEIIQDEESDCEKEGHPSAASSKHAGTNVDLPGAAVSSPETASLTPGTSSARGAEGNAEVYGEEEGSWPVLREPPGEVSQAQLDLQHPSAEGSNLDAASSDTFPPTRRTVPRFRSVGDNEGFGGQVLMVLMAPPAVREKAASTCKQPRGNSDWKRRPCMFLGFASGMVMAVTAVPAQDGWYDFSATSSSQQHTNELTALAFVPAVGSAGGQILASASVDGKVFLYPQSLSNKFTLERPILALTNCNCAPIISIAATKMVGVGSKETVVICTGDQQGNIRLWSCIDSTQLSLGSHDGLMNEGVESDIEDPPGDGTADVNRFRHEQTCVSTSTQRSMAYSPIVTHVRFVRNNMLITGNNCGDIRIWDLTSDLPFVGSGGMPKCSQDFGIGGAALVPKLVLRRNIHRAHTGTVEWIDIYGDVLLSSGGNDGQIKGWDLYRGQNHGSVSCHAGRIFSPANLEEPQHPAKKRRQPVLKSPVVGSLLHSNNKLVSLCRDGTLHSWDFNSVPTEAEISVRAHDENSDVPSCPHCGYRMKSIDWKRCGNLDCFRWRDGTRLNMRGARSEHVYVSEEKINALKETTETEKMKVATKVKKTKKYGLKSSVGSILTTKMAKTTGNRANSQSKSMRRLDEMMLGERGWSKEKKERMRISIIKAAYIAASRPSFAKTTPFVGADGEVYDDIKMALRKYSGLKACAECRERHQGPFVCRLRLCHHAPDVDDPSTNSFDVLQSVLDDDALPNIERADDVASEGEEEAAEELFTTKTMWECHSCQHRNSMRRYRCENCKKQGGKIINVRSRSLPKQSQPGPSGKSQSLRKKKKNEKKDTLKEKKKRDNPTPESLLGFSFIGEHNGLKQSASVEELLVDGNFRVHFLNGGQEIMSYNEIVEIYDETMDVADDDQLYAFTGILDHRRVKGHSSRYEVQVNWSRGEPTWEPVSEIKKSDPLTLAEYAQRNGLTALTGWRWAQDLVGAPSTAQDMASDASGARTSAEQNRNQENASGKTSGMTEEELDACLGWECSRCTLVNKLANKKCIACGKKKGRKDSPTTSLMWKCTSCTFLNESRSTKCGVCDQLKCSETDMSLPGAVSMTERTWTCIICHKENPEGYGKCSACHTMRDEAKRQGAKPEKEKQNHAEGTRFDSTVISEQPVEDSWLCHQCTLPNPVSSGRCSMCNAPKVDGGN